MTARPKIRYSNARPSLRELDRLMRERVGLAPAARAAAAAPDGPAATSKTSARYGRTAAPKE